MLKLKKILTAALVMAALPLAAQNSQDRNFEIAKNLEVFSNVYKTLNYNYVDEVDPGKSIKAAIDAMLAQMDPYTVFYPESDMEDVKLQLMGQYGGIGALVHKNGDHVYIAEPYENMPAHKAGLKAGDMILSINGENCTNKEVSDVSNLLRGQAGTSLTVKVDRNGTMIEKTFKREEIKLPNVPYYGFVGKDFGYIKLDEFTQDAAKNVRDAFKALKAEKPDMKGVILDLRGNGGGLMNEAVDIVNIWEKKGETVVETKGKIASKNLKSITHMEPIDTKIPVAVLINGYSASASEIVSGSLQDFDRAVIIGSRSFGKGLVQNILPLVYNNQMKVTVSKYYIPSGRCIQAIDYANRDENGKAVKVPDSLKTAFLTRNGRTVYDGFGIEPDVETEPEYMSALSATLVQKFYIFDYATKFAREHESIDEPETFQISDEVFNDFKNYLSGKDYSYSTDTEKMLAELRDVAKEEKYIDAIGTKLDELETQFKKDKADDLNKYKKEICLLLKEEILARYYYERGRIIGALTDDPDIDKAIEVLGDAAQYKKILSK